MPSAGIYRLAARYLVSDKVFDLQNVQRPEGIVGSRCQYLWVGLGRYDEGVSAEDYKLEMFDRTAQFSVLIAYCIYFLFLLPFMVNKDYSSVLYGPHY